MISVTVQIEDDDPDYATVISSAFEEMDELNGFIEKVKVFSSENEQEKDKKKPMGFQTGGQKGDPK